jgi:alkanesulfonate monooxygenase SsuD/methylene tetrahydromethanopterin reductase-like flavin-dependent oxidoreductase (luciferase family)
MSSTRQLHLGAFMRPAGIHTGAWRYPGAYADANFNIAHLKRFAQTLERAKFDAFFMADHMAVLNMPLDALKPATRRRRSSRSRCCPPCPR